MASETADLPRGDRPRRSGAPPVPCRRSAAPARTSATRPRSPGRPRASAASAARPCCRRSAAWSRASSATKRSWPASCWNWARQPPEEPDRATSDRTDLRPLRVPVLPNRPAGMALGHGRGRAGVLRDPLRAHGPDLPAPRPRSGLPGVRLLAVRRVRGRGARTRKRAPAIGPSPPPCARPAPGASGRPTPQCSPNSRRSRAVGHTPPRDGPGCAAAARLRAQIRRYTLAMHDPPNLAALLGDAQEVSRCIRRLARRSQDVADAARRESPSLWSGKPRHAA